MKRPKHFLAVAVAIGITTFQCGCREQSRNLDDKTPRLKTFLGNSDELAVIQRLPPEMLTIDGSDPNANTENTTARIEPGNLGIAPVIIEEVNNRNAKLRGARVSLNEHYFVVASQDSGSTEGKHENGTAVLDDDELNDLVNAVDYVQKRSKEWTSQSPKFETMVEFRSKDGLQLILGQNDKDKKWVSGISIGDAQEQLSEVQLSELKSKLGQVIDSLKQN